MAQTRLLKPIENRVDNSSNLGHGDDKCLALATLVNFALHGGRRVDSEIAASHKRVEHRSNGRKVGWYAAGRFKLNVSVHGTGLDLQGLDIHEIFNTGVIELHEEAACDRLVVLTL